MKNRERGEAWGGMHVCKMGVGTKWRKLKGRGEGVSRGEKEEKQLLLDK